MIKPDLTHCTSLEHMYDEAHKAYIADEQYNYRIHHDALREYADDCSTIKELGVMQGISLASMMFSRPKRVTGIDIDDRRYRPYHKHFVKYAKDNNIEYKYILGSSTDKKLVSDVDLIHIDTLHKPEQLKAEMALHLPSVKKYAIFHDTTNYRSAMGLFVAIAKYITEVDQDWRVIEHNTDWCGFTVLERHIREC